jgi:hypothetical protein
MSEITLGKLTKVDPRTVWAHEAQGFTPWLAENLDSLNEALGLEIELTGTEQTVGSFAVDIYGREVGSGHEVIIENQLAPTDHGHLGQLLTYASGLDAKIIVWISPQFRDEHRQALDWLNRETAEGISFFGIELELLRIGDSPPAPNFKLASQPSEWQKSVRTRGDSVGRRTDKQEAYHRFFSDLVEEIHSTAPGFTNVRRVGYDHWLHFAVGRSGFAYSLAFTSARKFRVELEVDPGDFSKNRLAFQALQSKRDFIEERLGSLTWDIKESRRTQRIYVERDGVVDDPAEKLHELRTWGITTLLEFKAVLSPLVKAIDLDVISPAPIDD